MNAGLIPVELSHSQSSKVSWRELHEASKAVRNSMGVGGANLELQQRHLRTITAALALDFTALAPCFRAGGETRAWDSFWLQKKVDPVYLEKRELWGKGKGKGAGPWSCRWRRLQFLAHLLEVYVKPAPSPFPLIHCSSPCSPAFLPEARDFGIHPKTSVQNKNNGNYKLLNIFIINTYFEASDYVSVL